jgi:hypothetical protein
MLWVRPLNSLTAQRVAGTEDAVAPFWSPDSRFIGFATVWRGGNVEEDRRFRRSADSTLCSYIRFPPQVRRWNRDGVILFTATGSGGGPIFKVSDAGGRPRSPSVRRFRRNRSWNTSGFVSAGRTSLSLPRPWRRPCSARHLSRLTRFDERKLPGACRVQMRDTRTDISCSARLDVDGATF